MLSSTPLLVRLIFLIFATFPISSNSLANSQHIFLLTNGESYTEIPFTLLNNLIIVEVVVAGERTMNFILDNGTSNPVIFQREYISGLSLDLGTKILFRGAGTGKAVRATVITGTSLHLSGAASDRIGMVVLNKNPFGQMKINNKTIHGVLGSTLFRSFIVEIDYPNQLLRLHQHKNFSAPTHYQMLPMKIVKGKPYISALVQGESASMEMDLMFDSGFNNSLLLQVSDSLAKKIIKKSRVARIGIGYSGILKGREGNVASVLIGSNYNENVATIAPFSRSLPTEILPGQRQRMGSVGNTMFINTSIILNYPDEQFYIAYPEPLLAEQEGKLPMPQLNIKKKEELIF